MKSVTVEYERVPETDLSTCRRVDRPCVYVFRHRDKAAWNEKKLTILKASDSPNSEIPPKPVRGLEMSDLEQRIRDRAHKIWMDEGCPEGRADVHWGLARELIAMEDSTALTLRVPSEGAAGPAGEPPEEASAAVADDLPNMVDPGEQQYPPSRPSRSRSEGWFRFGRRG